METTQRSAKEKFKHIPKKKKYREKYVQQEDCNTAADRAS